MLQYQPMTTTKCMATRLLMGDVQRLTYLIAHKISFAIIVIL
jgi:hypothetical protein